MTSVIGNLSLGLAMLIATLGVLLAVASVKFDSRGLLKASRTLVVLFGALMTAASGALLAALLGNQFDLNYVAQYSERALPLGYKLAAFWAGQEGSLLLWAWLLGAYGVLFVARAKQEVGRESSATLVTIFSILGFFAALMLFAANPFLPSEQVVADGRGLNPMLQDPGMIAHPPLLFLGYAGFAIPFAMMIGALIANRRDNEWIGFTRRWVMASWLMLTIGILLGAQWAYVELGWGGYWAWDPVENASLLPWLTGTALLHSMMAQRHRGMLKLWNVSLIALTFALCIFGSYLTRSGVIQSVHSFGKSVIGTFFLTFLIAIIIASVAIILVRRNALVSEHAIESIAGREAMFLATNILLLGITIVTLIGTISPILSGLFGSERAATKDFYNRWVVPASLILVALMAVGPLLAYGADAAKRLVRGMILPAILAIGAMIGFWFYGIRNTWALICVAITVVALSNVLIDVACNVRSIGKNYRRYTAQAVHVGVILIVAGIAGSSLFSKHETFALRSGDTVEFANRRLTLAQVTPANGQNYAALRAVVRVADISGNNATTLSPEIRRYNGWEEQLNTEVAIDSNWRQDVYLTVAAYDGEGLVTIQAIVNPLVSWIWVGGIVLTIGALIGLLPRLARREIPVIEAIKLEAKPAKRRMAVTAASV